MGIFGNQKINDARISGGGVYFEPGEYVCEIEDVKVIKTRAKGLMFVADLLILESSNPKRPINSHVNHTVLVDQDYGPGNIKEFMIAAMGLNPYEGSDAPLVAKEDWDENSEAALSDEKPLNGHKINIRALHKAKKGVKKLDENNPDTFFTRVYCYPNPDTREHFVKEAK